MACSKSGGSEKTVMMKNGIPVHREENWNENDTRALIIAWRTYINELWAQKRNRHVYDKIREALAEEGFHRSTPAIQIKIQNLSQTFRKEKAKVESGGAPSAWKYYEAVTSVIGHLPSNDTARVRESVSPVEYSCEMTVGVESCYGTSQDSGSSSTSQLDDTPSACAANAYTEYNSLSYPADNARSSNPQQSPNPQPPSNPRPPSPSSRNQTGINGIMEKILVEARRANDIAERMELHTHELLQDCLVTNKRSLEIQDALLAAYIKRCT